MSTTAVPALSVIRFARISPTTGKLRTGYVHHVNCVTHKMVMTSRPKALCLTPDHLTTLATNMAKYARPYGDVEPGTVELLPANATDTARYVAWREACERAYPTR